LLALDAIMREWTSSRSVAQRSYNISGGTITSSNTAGTSSTDDDNFTSRNNGGYYLKVCGSGQNVYDDNAKDYLYGEAGNDWLLVNNDGDGGSTSDYVNTGGQTYDRITDID
jgi:hypothetical protein